MSQQKVDQYKSEKKNRKVMIKKQKMLRKIRLTVGSVIGIALIGWIGFSGYNAYMDNLPREMASINYTAVDEYLNSL